MFKTAIKKGFKLLDKEKPGWTVDLDKLVMSSLGNCVLGQNGGYEIGLFNLGIMVASKYGFSVEDTDNYKIWCILTAEVKELIRERNEKETQKNRAPKVKR